MRRGKTTPSFGLLDRLTAAGPFHAFSFAAAAVFVSVVGCAKIADPLPPEILIPKAAVDLRAEQRADYALLEVSLPVLNTNGTAVTTLRRVDVYRLSENAPSKSVPEQIPENQFRQKAERILSIREEKLSNYIRRNSLFIEDRFSKRASPIYDRVFRYAVLFVNDKNQASGFSNQAVVAPVAIPLPPEKITVEVTETSLNLSWTVPAENTDGTKPARISGYNVYRSEKSEAPPATPVNALPLEKPEFKDVRFQFDRTYFYRVSVLGGPRERLIESRLSDALAITPRDTFPPLPAENFTVIFETDGALLLWNPSPSNDVAGYRLSKRENEAGGWKPLPGGLIAGVYSHRDESIEDGMDCQYAIIAVDAHGNESAPVRAETAIP
ncbi:MAG: fibronectin type III domain-containing protein [Acidobacteria bacterium]|nr:fibronectin type III domain-containing protein [Acidobacteriota bacterium]